MSTGPSFMVKSKQHFVLQACLILLGIAQSCIPTNARAEDDLPRTPDDPYADSYLHFEVTRNIPISRSRDQFQVGPYHPAFTYLRNINGRWLMGLGAQYKILAKKDADAAESDQIALFSLVHASYFNLRLYHPLYLLAGPKLYYFFPSKTAKLPMQRDSAFETEIGAALSIMFAYVLNQQTVLTVRVDRWRGTRTTLFQGLEGSLGLALAL